MKKILNSKLAFTLPEILIAIALFSIVTTVVATLYVQSFRETRRANLHNQIYDDARFILQNIADEIRDGSVDYDEYYNQYVILEAFSEPPLHGALAPAEVGALGVVNFGQNYGRYYSSFFNPGDDEALGFDCNTVRPDDGVVGGVGGERDDKRNLRNCTQLKRTVDRNTGENPFTGKYNSAGVAGEDAFCGTVTYSIGGTFSVNDRRGLCNQFTGAPLASGERALSELYLISANGMRKTILARERIGGTAASPVYALALLRLQGIDLDNDGIADRFVCAEGFQCRGGDDFDVTGEDPALGRTESDAACFSDGTPEAVDLPHSRDVELNPAGPAASDLCDTGFSDPNPRGFSVDFVPLSPRRVNVTKLDFYVSPTEDPHYAFAEASGLTQPRVTIVLTVEQNTEVTGSSQQIAPITLVQTVSSRVLTPIPAPLLVRPPPST